MTRISLLILAAMIVAGSSTATSALNNEFICSQPGYAMDQRCSGN
jgi:hypothetical protein